MGIVGSPSIRQHFLRTIACGVFLASCGRIGLELESVEKGVLIDAGGSVVLDGQSDTDARSSDDSIQLDGEVSLDDGGEPSDSQLAELDADPSDASFADASGVDASLQPDAASCVPGTCGCDVQPPPGLIAHFTLNESSGTTARDDVAGRTGTLQNMAAVAFVAGRLGNALDFDGNDDMVNVGTIANNVSALSFWLRADSFGITSNQTGWLAPSSTGSPNNEWSNPTRAYVKDGSSTSAFIALLVVTKTQDWGGFNISVPSTVRGIEAKTDSGGLSLLSGTGIELSWNAGGTYTSAGYGGSGLIEAGSNTTTFGTPTQLWGRGAWSASELNNANLRVRVRAGGLLGTASIDYLQLNVHYDSFTANRNIMRLSGSVQLELAGQTVSARGFPAGTQIYVDGALRSNVDTSWHHVVISSPSNIDVSGLQLGGVTGESPSFEGLLDDIKLFNQPQSAANVQTLFTMPTCGL